METARQGEHPEADRPTGSPADLTFSCVEYLNRCVDVVIRAARARHPRAACGITAKLLVICQKSLADLSHIAGEGTTDQLPQPGNGGSASELLLPLGRNVFRKSGEVWLVRFAGGAEFRLLDSKGAAYLHILLSNPGKVFPVVDAVYEVAKVTKRYAMGNAGEKSDRNAIAAYRRELCEMSVDLERAVRDNDEARQDQIRGDMERLKERINKDLALGGRLRKEADDHERFRKSFQAAIRRLLKEIAKHDKSLVAHLAPPHLTCGSHPCYNPLDGTEWET